MKPRRFTTKVEITHKSYLAHLLGMTPSRGTGIYLLSEEIGIELKCRYSKYIKHNYACCENEYQNFPGRYPNRELYLAFLIYGLSREPKEIPKERLNLEPYVTERIVKFVQWDFIANIPVSSPKKSGPFRYVSISSLPSDGDFNLFEEGKTRLYIPKESKLEGLVRERVESITQGKVIVRYRGNEKLVTYS